MSKIRGVNILRQPHLGSVFSSKYEYNNRYFHTVALKYGRLVYGGSILWEGSVVLHCRLEKFRGLMYNAEYSPVIG